LGFVTEELSPKRLPPSEKIKIIERIERRIFMDRVMVKLIMNRKRFGKEQAERWLYEWYRIKNREAKITRWKTEIGEIEELVAIIEEAVKERQRRTREGLKKFLKPRLPELPVVKIDRTTSKELLPLFLNKGIFSNFNQIHHIQDIIAKEEKRIGRKLTAKEKRDLEIKTGEYKKDGYVWKEFPGYAIGFGYKHFREYLEEMEKFYQKRKEEAEVSPFLFPDMKKEIEEVLRKIKIYKKGQDLAYGILGEVFLQKTSSGVILPKKNAVYYIGHTPEDKGAYQDVKEILNSLMWLSYRITGRENSNIKGAIGNFIYNVVESSKQYILDINPVYVGCIQQFFRNKERRTRKERKELFSRGYFNFPMKALAISKGYSASTQEFRNYLLREKGNTYLNSKKYKVISQKIKIYIRKACLRYKKKDRNYKVFVEEVLPTLIRDRFIAKIEPSLDELKALSPKIGYETNLKIYVPKIKKLDKSLEEVLRKRWGNWTL